MITKRIIPCLDVKDGRVVKGVNFKGLSDVSSPVELGKYYSQCGADELVFYDIDVIDALREWRIVFILAATFMGIIGIVVALIIFIAKLSSIGLPR